MKVITNKSTTNKQYSYQVGKTTLNFMLNQDTVHDLEEFKRLLEVALTDVSKDILKIKNNDK